MELHGTLFLVIPLTHSSPGSLQAGLAELAFSASLSFNCSDRLPGRSSRWGEGWIWAGGFKRINSLRPESMADWHEAAGHVTLTVGSREG